METIIVWSFIAYGMTTIIVYGSIFDKVRNYITLKSEFFGKLLSCILCTSTWVGVLMSIFIGSITKNYIETFILVHIFIDGMFTAGIVWAINSVIEFFEESRIK